MSDSNLPSGKNQPQKQQDHGFLQQLADLTPEFLFVIDLDDLEIVYINKKAEQLLGRKASAVYELGHKVFKSLLHPEDYQRRMKNLKLCSQLPDEQESEVEVRLKSADGNWRWFRIRDKVFKRNSQGAVSQVIGTAQEIHEQKMADEKRREEHRRLKDAQAIGHIGSFERPLPGETILCSAEFLRIHDLPQQPEILSTEQFLSFVHPEDREAFLEAVRQTHATGKPLNLINRILLPDGRIRHVHRRSDIFKDAQGTPIRVYGTIQDITQQVEARDKEQTNEALLREAEAVGNFGSYMLYFNKKQLEVSEGFYRLFGYEPGEMEADLNFINKLTHPEDIGPVMQVIEQAWQDKQPYQYLRRIFLPDGQLRELSSTGKVVCNATGEPEKLVGIVYDVSQLRKSEQTIQQMLQGSMAAISIFESVRNKQGTLIDFIYRGGNKAAEKAFNKPLHEMLDRPVLGLLPGVKEGLFDNYMQVVETGQPLRLERYYPNDGFNHWFDISAVKNGDGLILTLHDITDRKKAEQEFIRVKDELAQQATDKYLKLFNSINEGFCIIEVIFRADQEPVDFRYIDTNLAFEEQTGQKNAPGRTIRELMPDIEPFWLHTYGKVALSGEAVRFEGIVEPKGGWFEIKAFRIGKPEERQVAVLFNDITEQKRQEENLSFLAELQYDFTRLSSAEEIVQVVADKVYQHYGLSRLTMWDVGEATEALTSVFEKHAPQLKPSASEIDQLSDLLPTGFIRENKGNRIIAIENLSTDPRTALRAHPYYRHGAGAQLLAPFVRQDKWCFIISLQKSAPYSWRPDETELLQEVVTRLFLRLERARAEEALQKSEAKYRDLFNSIEQGFALVEVILDEKDTPVDCRILEVNKRFEALTGIAQEEALSGKTLREIKPDLEEKWFRYGRVVLTGEPLYVEDYSEALGNRWFGLNVYQHNEPEKRQLALLYHDITDRKQAEEQIRKQNAVLEGINRIFREALSSQTEEELGRVCLNVAEEVTGSRIGFMGEVNPTSGKLEDIAISDRSWKEFGVKDTSSPKKLLPAGLRIHGIYGRVLRDKKGFFTNNPSSHPDSIGTPKSHPKLNSFLGVPLLKGGRAIGMIGLANREGGYGAEELELLEALAPAIVQALLRKRAEEAQIKSDEQFRTVVDLVPDLLWSKDSQGIVDWYNQQWLNYTGQTFEGATEYSWLNNVHPEDQEYSRKAFQAAVADGEMFRIEHRIRRHDGMYRWFLVQKRLIKDESGKILRWYGSATDVHEERLAMENLRQSEEKFRFMADNIPQIIWISDAAGKVEFVNQVFFSYNGARKKPADAWEMAELYVHPEDIPSTMDRWHKAMKQGISFTVEHRIKSAQGEYRWFLVRAEPYPDPESGNIIRWFGTSTDIHDNKRTEEALIKAKETAEKAAKAKEEFLSTMSHEIRTPLNAVVGFTHLLLQQKPREDQQESLSGLRYSSKNLMSLINDILDFSKIEAGKVELEENEFDLLDLMFSLKQAHLSAAQENNTQLKLSLDDEIPEFVISDQLKLSQVLHNLLSNAVKFTRQGLVSLDINLEKQEGENIWLNFAVADTGIGIAEEKLHRIFEKFTQADSSTIRHYGGTGLGLSISKLLLELMGSQIKVESQEGEGSRFYFTLPAKAGTGTLPREGSPEEKEERKDLQQAKILLVEDVEFNRQIIRKFMKEWWELLPDEAVNGKEAVEKAAQDTYDLILMDVRMPEMNGIEATRIIRGLPGKENTPVLALTADTGSDIRKKPEAALFTDVITKPFDPADLRRTILHYLPEKKAPLPRAASEPKKAESGFGEAKKAMKEDQEGWVAFYKLTITNLKEYKAAFQKITGEKDIEKLTALRHKAIVLLDTFSFNDLKALLSKARDLLEAKATDAQIKQLQMDGEKLFNQKIQEVQDQLKKAS